MTNYCKDCDHRELGCHGNCEAYKAYKQWNEERKLEDRAKRMTIMYTPQDEKRMHKYKQRYRRENK